MVSTGQEARPAVDAGVLATQQLLARSGFYEGIPNGIADESYIAAIRRARRAVRLPDGDALNEARERLERRLGEAQSALRDLGVYNGPVDGIPNDALDAALRAFQIRERLPSSAGPTPVLDDVTLARLKLRAAEAKLPATPPIATPPVGMPPPVAMPGLPPPTLPVGAAPPMMAAAPAPATGVTPSNIIAGVFGMIAGGTFAAFLLKRGSR